MEVPPRGPQRSSPDGRWPVRLDRLIDTTITLTVVLVVYDG